MARFSALAIMLPVVQASNTALNKAMLQVEGQVEHLEGVATQQNPLGLLWAFMSLIIFCIASYLVYKWHNDMKTESKTPACGIKSAACCILCLCGCGTFLTICFPIDEGAAKEKEEGEEAAP